MTKFILAQIVMLCGSFIMIASGLPKKKTQIVTLQTIQIALMTLGNALLGSIAGAVTNVFGLARNMLHINKLLTLPVQLVLIAANIVSIVPMNNLGWIGMLPILATCAFTAVMNCKSIIIYKCVFISTCIMWLVHDIYIKSYATVPFDILGIITNALSILRQVRATKATT